MSHSRPRTGEALVTWWGMRPHARGGPRGEVGRGWASGQPEGTRRGRHWRPHSPVWGQMASLSGAEERGFLRQEPGAGGGAVQTKPSPLRSAAQLTERNTSPLSAQAHRLAGQSPQAREAFPPVPRRPHPPPTPPPPVFPSPTALVTLPHCRGHTPLASGIGVCRVCDHQGGHVGSGEMLQTLGTVSAEAGRWQEQRLQVESSGK